MRSNNPVLTRRDTFAVEPEQLERMWATPARMTVDDVVVRTATLLAVLGATGAVAWFLELYALALPAALVGFGLAMWATFRRSVSPALYLAYAAVEGVFLGAISRLFETTYDGIVGQAALATGACFVAVLVAYRSGRLRATPRFRRVVTTAMLGVLVLYGVQLVAMLFGGSLPVINDSTPLGILFSIAVVALAAVSFVLDFDEIERAIADGVPEPFAWRAAFGLVVGLVWLYVEMLRLLSKLRDR